MYHALIVDDEIHAVRGLRAGVRWEKLNISSVHTAHNARQAKDVFENGPVDLLLCDIEMPKGSGLELLTWVREHFPKTETIFLTCHSEFTYAQQALQLNSFDYMLKPIDYEELENVMKKALGKIAADREMGSFKETYKRYYQLWESHKPEFQERFWQDLIQQTLPSKPQAIEEYLSKKDISYPRTEKYLPVLISVHHWHKMLTPREEQIMVFALRNAAEETIIGKDPSAIVVPRKNNLLLAVLPVDSLDEAESLSARCDRYIDFCCHHLFCDICCYIGEPVLLHEMASMYTHLKQLDENNVTCANRTIELRRDKRGGAEIQPPPMSEWAQWMKQGDKDRLISEITRYLKEWDQSNGKIDVRSLHVFYQDVIQVILYVLQVKGLQAHEVFSNALLSDKPARAFRSLGSFREWMVFIVEVAMNHIHSLPENLSIVEKVEHFILENIEKQNLTREDIAQHVYLNPDYLTRVFKKEKGMTISDYLQLQRMEYAKKLLENTGLSISDVALQSGYSNISYFSTLFKKAVKMNPSDYRRTNNRGLL